MEVHQGDLPVALAEYLGLAEETLGETSEEILAATLEETLEVQEEEEEEENPLDNQDHFPETHSHHV